MLGLVAAAAAGFAGGSPPRRLPSGPLIVGYTGCDQQKVIAEAAKGVNVGMHLEVPYAPVSGQMPWTDGVG